MRLFVKAVVMIVLCSNLSFAHDEGEKLEVDCSQIYRSAGSSTFDQIVFSFSQKNLEAHDAIDSTSKWPKFSVIAELLNTTGETVKHAGSIGYSVKDGKISIMQNWITVGEATTPEELSDLKADLGRHPKTKCHLIL